MRKTKVLKLISMVIVILFLLLGIVGKSKATETTTDNVKLTLEYTNDKSNLASEAELTIDGITFDDSKTYIGKVTHDLNEPDESVTGYVVDKTTGKVNVAEGVEENGDLYFWLYECEVNVVKIITSNLIIKGKKFERAELPEYGNRIIWSSINNGVFIATNVPRKFETESYTYRERNITIKIGKVTDKEILNEIKNNDKNGMSDLLSYAKEKDDAELIETTKSNSTSLNSVDISKLTRVDNCYYYVYSVMDDENGKYYPIEDINLLYSIYTPPSSLTSTPEFFALVNLTDDKFKWNIDSDEEQSEPKNEVPTNEATPTTNSTPTDKTVATKKLAQTGEKSIIFIVAGLVVLTIVLYKKFSDLKLK